MRAPLKEEEKTILKQQLTDRCLASGLMLKHNPEDQNLNKGTKKLHSLRLSYLKEHCGLFLMNHLTMPTANAAQGIEGQQSNQKAAKSAS